MQPNLPFSHCPEGRHARPAKASLTCAPPRAARMIGATLATADPDRAAVKMRQGRCCGVLPPRPTGSAPTIRAARSRAGRSACTGFRCTSPPSARSERPWRVNCGSRAHRWRGAKSRIFLQLNYPDCCWPFLRMPHQGTKTGNGALHDRQPAGRRMHEPLRIENPSVLACSTIAATRRAYSAPDRGASPQGAGNSGVVRNDLGCQSPGQASDTCVAKSKRVGSASKPVDVSASVISRSSRLRIRISRTREN